MMQLFLRLPIHRFFIFFFFIFANYLQAQAPNDCVNAIAVCDDQQLNYNSNGPGINDFGPGPNNFSNGCLLNDEHQSAWFQIFISPNSPPGATLAFTLTPSGGAGEDYDFALYGPNVGCNGLGSPIRCSYASAACGFCPQTGMGMGQTDFSEGAGGNGFVAPLATQPGQSYILLVDNWASSSQGFFLEWTGTAILACPCTTIPTITGNLQTCPGQPTTLTANGTNLSNYLWTASGGGSISGPNNQANVSANSPGTYTVVVTDASGCTGSASVTVTAGLSPVLNPVPTQPSCGQSNGSINLTVSNGISPYNFLWSNGSTNQNLSNVPAGTYTVTVTGANGCTATASVPLSDTNPTLNLNPTITNSNDCLTGNGAISVNASPPGAYTYSWSNGASTPDITNLAPGSYTLTVTIAPGCTQTATYSVTNQPVLPVLSTTTVPSTCGLPNGSIDLTASGAGQPFVFSWSNGALSEDLTNVDAGTYTVTVTGANGCSATTSATIANNSPPINVNGTVVQNTACSSGNGSISLTVTPAGTYQYNWSNGAITSSISDLTPGSYSVTVSSGGSCTQTANFTVPDQPNTPNASITPTGSTCDQPNGSANLSVSGGVSPYTFQWSNSATTEDLSSLPVGSYTVTVTGANGCTTTAGTSVSNTNPPITINGNVVANTTCTGGNGSISINVSPVVPPVGAGYTYNWSNGAVTPNLFNLTPGSYTVTVTAGGSCTQVASFTIPNQPDPPLLTPNVTASTCGLNNGAVVLGVSAGVSPYTYNWSNGNTSANLANVLAGSYTVTVTGANGCTATTTVNVPDNPVNFTVNNTIVPNSSCNSTTYDGSVTIGVIPAGIYTYTWSNGSTGTSLTGLAPGNYTVTVSAGGNCTQTLSYSVPNQPNPPILTPNSTPSICGLPNGAASITVSGGVAPYTYNWSTGGASPSLNNLPAGSYTVTVTGANSCTSVQTVTVANNNPVLTVTGNTTGSTSCVSGNGSINLFVQPTGSYTYQWSNGSAQQNLTNLIPGTYTVTVTTGASCSATASFTIPNDAQVPVITPTVTPSICSNANGAINLSVSGGLAPITYAWSNGATTQNLSNLTPGGYSVTVTTGAGCTSTSSFVVTSNDTPITLSGSAFGNASCGAPGGVVNLVTQPLTPPVGGSYSYTWSNGATTQNLQGVVSGNYTVTVSIGPACTQTASFFVPNLVFPPELQTAITSATCGQNNGAINLTVANSTPPYFYNWSNNSINEDLTGLAPGTYSVTVTDGNNCTASTSVTVVNNNLALNISGTPAANTSCTATNGSINITVTPTGTYTYNWSNNATTEDLSGLAAGTYTVTVSAGGTCTSTASFTVTDQTSTPQITPNVTAAICGESNGAISLTVAGASTPYTYTWSNSATTSSITSLSSGNYTVTVSGANGCTSTAIINVPNNSSSFSLAGTAQPVNSCTANNGSINLTITPSGTYNILWSNNATTEDLSGLAAGSYTVTVTESGSCTASASFTVTNDATLPTTSQTVTAEVCGQNNGAIDLNVSGATTPYTFLWSNAAATEDLAGIAAGNYTVTVTGANGCSTTASATVPTNNLSFSLNGATVANNSCSVTNGSIDLSVTPAGIYTFLWSNNAASEDLTGLAGGSYTVTVSAGGTCTATSSFTVGSTTLDPVISQNITAAICGESNGGINLTISGGQAPFSFLWSNNASTEDLSNLAPGNYTVQVTGGNGCVANGSFTVPNNNINFAASAALSANTSCSSPNGSIDLSVTPAGTYIYLWSNNATVEDLTNLAPGNYTVTVSQGLTCSTVGNFTVGNNTNAPNFTQNITPAVCGGSNGGIDLTATGGTTPYQFLWSNNTTTEDLNGLPGGNYGVTVTGADGCSNTGNFTVPDNLISINITGTTQGNTACTGGNGAVDITVAPAGSYTFTWSNNATVEDLANLPGGGYQVTVSAGGTCTSVGSFNVPDNPDAPSVSANVAASVCSAPDGGIDLTVEGGLPPYQFNWSNNASSEDISGIIAGTYNVVVTAANGCTATGSFNVPNVSNTFTFSGSSQANTLCGSGNGSIDLNVTPPGSYIFTWSNNAITEDLANLTAGTYTVTISDGGSCTASGSFTVGNNAPTISVTGVATDVLCFGENTGSIVVTATGGVMPYTFDWTTAVPDLLALAAGTYSVVATDASGCTGTASFTIQQPASAVQLGCTQTANVTLPGANDGAGSVNITGGAAPYSVAWSPGSTQGGVTAGSFPISNLVEGDYNVQVTDANGCVATCSFNISTNACVTAIGSMQTASLTLCGSGCQTAAYAPLGQYLDADDVLQFVLHTGSSNLIVNEIARSDQPTFCFDPTLMSYGTTYYISAVAGNADGSGNVILTDDCTKVTVGTPVVFNEIPVANVNQPASLSCLVSQVQLTGSSTLAGSTFSWSTQNGTIAGNPNQASVQATAAGTYTLTVSAGGCSNTASVDVTNISTNVTANITSSPGELLDCTISQIILTGIAAGTANATYQWFLNGSQIGTGNPLVVSQGGAYQLVVTDPASGCTGSANISIDDNSDYPQLFVNPAALLNCRDTVVTISGGSPVNGVQFYWATIQGTDTTLVGSGASVPVNTQGTYYLVGTAPNGCVNAAPLTVSGNYTEPTANAGADQTLDCVQTPLTLTGSGTANTAFFWSANNSDIVIYNPASPTITVDEAGIYTLTVTNLGSFCTDTDDVEVFQYENVPQGEITAIGPKCFGDKNGSIVVETDPANGPYQYQLNGQNYGGTNVFAPLAPGNYEIQVVDGKGCIWTTSVYVPEPDQLTVELGSNLIVQLGQSATLQVQASVPVSQLDTILWTPATLLPCPAMPCDIQEIFPTQQTSVEVTVIDTNGCQASDAMALFIKKERQVYVPNAFSPNGDGSNDVFMIFAGPDVVKIKSFLVFNRWGETVFQYSNFQPNNPTYGWDGKHRGQYLNPAVFAWFAVVEFIDGQEVLFEGDVSLMR